MFFRVTLPLAWRGILAGVLLAFARALGEFGATLMVAGSIPGKTQTLSIAVYEAVQAGQDDARQRAGAADLGDLHRRAAARRPPRAGAHPGPRMSVGDVGGDPQDARRAAAQRFELDVALRQRRAAARAVRPVGRGQDA